MELLVFFITFIVFLVVSDKLVKVLWKKIKSRDEKYKKHLASVEVVEYCTKIYHEEYKEEDELTKILQFWLNSDENDIVKYRIDASEE